MLAPTSTLNARPRLVMRPRAGPKIFPRRTFNRSVAFTTLGASNVGDLFNRFLDDKRSAFASTRGPTTTRTLGPTNETVRIVDGMKHKRLGKGDIIVSELGLGTQRWGSADFNAPDETTCHEFLNYAVLERGVNLIDTAEQYPIPSDRARPEGRTEQIIGNWIAKDPSRRGKVVLATKITGGANVNRRNIVKDLEGSLLRM